MIEQMNDDLTRMVLNPDVTVRSRGVMEKCTFCIQKIQLAKLDAKKENRMLRDGDAKTACQMACSADAIVFGNIKDPNSAVVKMHMENPKRSFKVLEQLHTLPNITYFAKLRNTNEDDPKWMEADHNAKTHEGATEAAHPTATSAHPPLKPGGQPQDH